MNMFAKEMGFPEAPVFLPDGSLLHVEMSPDRGWVAQLSSDGSTRRVLAKTGRPNGLALDRNGTIWVAETAQRAVLRMSADGAYERFASECQGQPFLFLNDLAFGPDGCLYVTDSGIDLDVVLPGGEVNPHYRDLPYDGRVYRIDTETRRVDLIDRGLKFTNGLAFDAAGTLYVAETLTGTVHRYQRTDQGFGPRELFANVLEKFDPAVLQGPDGMKFGADGNLYVAVFGQGDVTVLDPHGKVLRRIKTAGEHPTNLAFGMPGSKQIYVTEVETGSVQVFDVGTDGLPLHG